MRKLLLINPVGRKSGYTLSRFTRFQPLGLGYVAAVTPSNWEIELVDENFEKFEFKKVDLVGITAFSSNINRAYEIAQICRNKGVKVVLGGIHGSMFTEEAIQYVDSVIIGEVEHCWEKVLSDFEKNRLSKVYNGPKIDLNVYDVEPKRTLFHQSYLWQSVQTSRGCPFDCSFCSVTRHLGNKYRKRKAENVIGELKKIKSHYIAFVDDNLIGYGRESINESKKLFRYMIDEKLNKKWWMQTSINAASDEEAIALAAKAGCLFVFIGFETIETNALSEMKKGVNLKIGIENYTQVVRVFNKYGIGVMGAFILGNDFESVAYYKKLGNFLMKSGMDITQISLLTPLPGTRLMDSLIEEGRIIYKDFPKDWDKYRFSYMVHHPKGVDSETIYIADNFLKNSLYSFPKYHIRLLVSFFRLKNLKSFFIVYKFNQALKKSWRNSHYFKKYPLTWKH